MTPLDSLLPVKAVATRLGVSSPTVFRLSASGELIAVEVMKGKRRCLRWRPEVVEAFIAAREQTTKQ